MEIPTDQKQSRTLGDVIALSDEVMTTALEALSLGTKSHKTISVPSFIQYAARVRLSCSVERQTVAHSQLQFWMERNGYGSGLTLPRSLKLSPGGAKQISSLYNEMLRTHMDTERYLQTL